MEASKNEIKNLQGLCILAMILLHLFCRLDYENLYSPWFIIAGKPICYYFAQISDFCVMGYAFCSGYAHTILYNTDGKYMKNRLKGVSRLLIDYWVIVVIFCLIGFLTGNNVEMPGSLSRFLGNIFLYHMDYNGAWWYLLTYILLVITSPIIISIIQKQKLWVTLPVLAIIYTFSYYVRFHEISSNFFFVQLYLYGMTMVEYSMGVYFYKYQVFTKVKNIFRNIPKLLLYAICGSIFFIMMMIRGLYVQSLFVAPGTGMIIILMFHLIYKEKDTGIDILNFIGNHSTNMWLTHMFFYLSLFVGFIWIAKYPLLIFILMIAITVIVSMLLKCIQQPLEKIVIKALFDNNRK